MRSLSPAELIGVWERGGGQAPVERALTLLEACEEEPGQDLAALSIGHRDARLMAVYERLFGTTLQAFAECPRCAERLEYSVSTGSVAAAGSHQGNDPLALISGPLRLTLRLPNSQDLRAVSGCADVGRARRMLAERCVVQAVENGMTVPPENLAEAVVDQIALRLSQADPQADTVLDLNCAACSHRWQIVLDIERFLWVKISVCVKRLLQEVHVLARAYGWAEAEILALSPIRRRMYLDMVQA